MKEYNYYYFDLFHTLVKIEPYFDINKREHNILGISQKKWSEFAEPVRSLWLINEYKRGR